MTHGTDEPSDADPDVGGDEFHRPRPGAHAAEGDGELLDQPFPADSDAPRVTAEPFEWVSGTASPVVDPYVVDPYVGEQSPAEQPAYEQGAYAQEHPQFEQTAYDQGAYAQEQPSYEQPSYEQQYEQPAYEQQYEQPQYEQPQYEQPQYEQPQYPVPPAAQQGFDQRYAQQPQPGQPQPGQYLPQQQFAPQPPPVAPRPEDLLVPNQVPVTDAPASWGWRGRLNRASGGKLKSKATADEIAVRQAINDIQHSFSRPMTVVVVQPKGGAGKTPTTICLSAAFGAYRGGYVVGWDDNETRGTLAVRVANPDNQQATAWDLLSDLGAFERYDARVGDLSHYVRAQPDAHFDALVSDDNPGNMAQIGEREYQRLHTVLQRFYRMIVVDTGNNVRSPNWQAAVNSADQIVVVSTYQRDVGYSASWVLDHLAQTGREELARNAVTVLTAADPTTDKTVRDQLLPHFRARTRAVCEIPYDQEVAHGGPIRWLDLADDTRNAWIHAGATIVNCLAENERRELAQRS